MVRPEPHQIRTIDSWIAKQADPNLPRPEAIGRSSSSSFGNECAELTKSSSARFDALTDRL